MTEHLTFILDKNYSSDINDKYICKNDNQFIILLPYYISRTKNNYPKSEIRISID
jgi:hypothetical protein